MAIIYFLSPLRLKKRVFSSIILYKTVMIDDYDRLLPIQLPLRNDNVFQQ